MAVEDGRILLLEGGSVESVLSALLSATPNAGELGVSRSGDYGPTAVYPVKTKSPGNPTYLRFVTLEGMVAVPDSFLALLGGPFLASEKLQNGLQIGGVFENVVRGNSGPTTVGIPVSSSGGSEVGRITFPDYAGVGDCIDFLVEIFYRDSSTGSFSLSALGTNGDHVFLNNGSISVNGSLFARGRINLMDNNTIRVSAELVQNGEVVDAFIGKISVDWDGSNPLILVINAAGDGPIFIADGNGDDASGAQISDVTLNDSYSTPFYVRIYRDNASGSLFKVFDSEAARTAGTTPIMRNAGGSYIPYSTTGSVTLEQQNASGKSGSFTLAAFTQGDESPIDLTLVPGGGFVVQQTSEYKPGPEHS